MEPYRLLRACSLLLSILSLVACGSTAAPTSTQSTATSLATDRAPQDIPADALVISNGMVIAADGAIRFPTVSS
jgi:hypothetical protein